MAKKLYGGDGWSFEPAGGGEAKEEVASLADDRQKATVKVEKRAKGKEVTAVAGFVLSAGDRRQLAQFLRKTCGAGGKDSPGLIEVQGDHRDKVRGLLAAKGWSVR